MKNKLLNYIAILFASMVLNLTNLSNAVVTNDSPEKHQGHSAFIAMKNGKIIKSIGNYDDRHAPFSTFKVVLAVMGFNEGILENKDNPKWPFKEEYEKNFQSWYTREKGLKYHWCEDTTPATFMKNSVLWYSHQVTSRLGERKFNKYVSDLNYGNMDVSGTPEQNDALLNSWLGTSLKISPKEQVKFLEKLCANELPVSKDAQEKTREVMDRDEVWNGWKLYGKTGGGSSDNGWFVGWVEKDGQRIIFAQYLDLQDINLDLTDLPSHSSVGIMAKELAKRELLKFLKK